MTSTERLKHREKHVKELMVRELEFVPRQELPIYLYDWSCDMYYEVKRAHAGVSRRGLTNYNFAVNGYDPANIHKVIDAFY